MCVYSHFQYLCLHEKLKIVEACSKAFRDSHGVLTCPKTPPPNTHNSVTASRRTYGLGVCGNIHCAWNHSILPIGEFGNEKTFGKSTSFEDDTEIEDSPALREERVGRWFKLLSADQQLDHFKTEYPIPEHELSHAGLALRNFPCHAIEFPALDTLRWQELNPLYPTPPMLQWCVYNYVLPASLVDSRKSKTITPRKPIFGPFQVQDKHRCSKKRGICKVCGRNIGSTELKEKVLSYRKNVALAKILIDEPAELTDLAGSAWDPNVELEWDDEKGEYRKVFSANLPVDAHGAPYPASSNPTFVPYTFGGQDVSLADSSTHASPYLGLTGGMDWEDFVMGATLDSGDQDWQHPGFFNTQGGLGTSNNFSFDTFTYAQPSELDNTNNHNQFTHQLPTSPQTSQPLDFSTNPSEHDMLFSSPEPPSQFPGVDADFFDDPMILCDSGEDQPTSARPAGNS